MRVLSLNGQWRGVCCTPDSGSFQYSAVVPGCAYSDMLRIGRIENPFWRMNNQKNTWIEQSDFSFSRAFQLDEAAPNAYLEFDGLDTFCSVWLNGEKVGDADDAHLQYRFPVGNVLKVGQNELEVRFRSAVNEVKDKPLQGYAFTGERIWIRRMQCTFYWDWVDRFVTSGIYRPCRLCLPDAKELDSVYVRTTAVDSFGAQVDVTLDFKLYDESQDYYTEQEILDPDGVRVWSKRRLIVEDVMDEEIDIPAPQLWWPNGYGAQPLYLYSVRVVSADGAPICEQKVRFGIRTLRLLQTEDLPGSAWEKKCRELKEQDFLKNSDKNETFSRFTVLVNGQPILMRGACWVPCEPLTSQVTDEKYRSLVELAKEAHYTAIRIWGGGQFEGDALFDACDEAGILITHDFLMACATYPEYDNEWFMPRLRAEAEHGAKRFRNHPCLAFWTGDNENAVDGNENMQDYPGRRAALRALHPTLKRFDPARPFVPGSPYYGVPNKSQTRGVTHNTAHIGDLDAVYAYDFRLGKRDMSDYRAFFEGKLARYIAEEPVMGAPQFCSLRKFMTEDDIFARPDKEMWRFHTKNNPCGIFQKFDLFDMTEAFAEGILGAFAGDADRVFKLQYLEYEMIRVTMENVRRNKWFSSAMIYWMFNDCWPASGWSMVDYYELPKAGWYGFKRTAAPVIASIGVGRDCYEVYVCNDTLKAATGNARVFIQPTAGGSARWSRTLTVNVPANTSQCVMRIPLAEAGSLLSDDAVLFCELNTQFGRDRAFCVPKTPGMLRRPAPKVSVLSLTEDCVTLRADSFAYAVALDGEYIFSDNYFSMLPGEEKEIHFRKSRTHEKDGFELFAW